MPVRKVVIDRANRLYQMPPEVADFVPSGRTLFGLGRSGVIDLASFHWPIAFEQDTKPAGDELMPATEQQLAALREELAVWINRTHGARIIPDKEIFIGGGISNLAFQMALAHIDSGDAAFVPSVGIPLYRACVTACNGQPITYTVSSKNDWSPRFDRLNTVLGRAARLLFLNSPHNPTGVELTHKEIAELVWTAGRQNILIINDTAYASLSNRPHASLLSVTGGKKVGVELGSFAYQFGLPALPFGYAVGNREAISGLKKTSRLVHAYLPSYAANLAVEAIRQYPCDALTRVRDRLTRASSEASQLMSLLRLERTVQSSVPFEWARIERRMPSTNLARTLLRRFRIVVAPGLAFGENGEGFLRFSLLAGSEAFAEACRRVRRSRIARKREDTE
ncbi:MAG: pyridoxal phosphate-dependent aminotransferase [Candidatus Zixiibacteriota bacterium]